MTKHKKSTSILIISRRLNQSQSAPKCNFNLAKSLLKLGHKVYVLTSYVESSVSQILRGYGGIVYVINPTYASRLKAPVLYSLSAKILKKKYKIDIVVGNGYTFGDDVTWVHFPRYGWIEALRRFKAPVPKGLRLEAACERLLFSTSRCFLAVSNMVREILLKYYGINKEKVIVGYNGVDIEYYNPLCEARRSRFREELGLSNRLLIMYNGGTSKRKGFDVLIREVAKIRAKNKIKLLVCGLSSENIANLTTVFKKHDLNGTVILEKWLGPDSLKLYYQISDIFVLPSLFDPFSLAALEAMACGSIPIISKYAGVAEVINHGVNGYIVNPNVEGEIASILNDMVDNSSRLASLREEAIKTANKLSWDNTAKLLMEKCNDLGII